MRLTYYQVTPFRNNVKLQLEILNSIILWEAIGQVISMIKLWKLLQFKNTWGGTNTLIAIKA